MFPHLTHGSPPRFAFVLHLRSREDMFRLGVSKFLRNYSQDEDEFDRKVKMLPPTIIGETLFGVSTFRGETIAVMRTPDEMIGRDAIQAVLEAVSLASSRDTPVIGLGALTSPVTNGGQLATCLAPPGVVITNGNGYTAAVVLENVAFAIERLGLPPRAKVAVIGCAGSVGCPASRLLAEAGHDLILVGRRAADVRQQLPDLAGVHVVTDDVADVRAADVVVVLASNVRLSPDQVRPRACVIDCCHPAAIPHASYEQFLRAGRWITQGGYVRIPGYRSTYDMDTPSAADTFACLAETYIVASGCLRTHSVGRPSVEHARRMARMAADLGIEVTPLALPELEQASA